MWIKSNFYIFFVIDTEVKNTILKVSNKKADVMGDITRGILNGCPVADLIFQKRS